LNAGAKAYAAGFVASRLGLPEGWGQAELIPDGLAEELAFVLRGEEPRTTAEPYLEKEIQELGKKFEKLALEEHGFFVAKETWPNGAPFAACLTHDVDNIERSASHLWARRERFSKLDLMFALLRLRSVYDNIAYVSRLERVRNLRSSFYFLTANYSLSKVAPEIGELRRGGWDVGLHGDDGTHDSAEHLAASVERFRQRLGFVPRGVREHYLRFDFAKTWEILERAGFDYDSTVGLRDRLGFRLGLAAPFHPPSPEWSPMSLLELPLVLMDTTLWGYLKNSEEAGIDAYRSLKEQVRRVKGLYTILWHQEAARMRGGRIYPRILDDLCSQPGFIASGEEISRWWRGREVPLVVEGNKVSIPESPPQGLVLRFVSQNERTLRVAGGAVERGSNGTLVRVESGGFKMEVD
jgi:peptidoglycan/xylan/chitin deacetylase (PgdA/CDA1 family)